MIASPLLAHCQCPPRPPEHPLPWTASSCRLACASGQSLLPLSLQERELTAVDLYCTQCVRTNITQRYAHTLYVKVYICEPAPLYSAHCNENLIYVFLFWELRGLSPNLHIHVSVSDIFPASAHIFPAAEQADR
jgi:hypothetical protein